MTVVSGFNAKTKKHLLLDAGCFFKNFDLAEDTFEEAKATKLIGATSGGGEFNVKPEIRQIAVDGVKGRAKGLEHLDSVEITFLANFLEMTPEILQESLAAADIADFKMGGETTASYKKISGKSKIEDSDYINNITYFGTISGSEKPVIVVVENALAIDGLKLSVEDKKESVLPVTFYGHYDVSGADFDGTPPYAIYYPIISSASSNG